MQGVMHTYSKSNEISNHDETLPIAGQRIDETLPIARRPAHCAAPLRSTPGW